MYARRMGVRRHSSVHPCIYVYIGPSFGQFFSWAIFGPCMAPGGAYMALGGPYIPGTRPALAGILAILSQNGRDIEWQFVPSSLERNTAATQAAASASGRACRRARSSRPAASPALAAARPRCRRGCASTAPHQKRGEERREPALRVGGGRVFGCVAAWVSGARPGRRNPKAAGAHPVSL